MPALTPPDDVAETARALVLMLHEYLLDTFGRGARVPVTVAAETVADLWWRAISPHHAPTNEADAGTIGPSS